MEAANNIAKKLVGADVLEEVSSLLKRISDKSKEPNLRAAPEWLTRNVAPGTDPQVVESLLVTVSPSDVIPPFVESRAKRVFCLSGKYRNASGDTIIAGKTEECAQEGFHVTPLEKTTLLIQLYLGEPRLKLSY